LARVERLKVEIFQLGVKIVPLKTRRPKRTARKNIASIAATRVCTLTFHGIRSREKNRFAFDVNAPLDGDKTSLCFGFSHEE